MNVTVRNVITSMRLISWFDWAQFVESVSLVDEVLRGASPFGGDGLRDPRPLPPRRRGARPRLAADRGRGRAAPPWRWRRGDRRRTPPTSPVERDARSRLLPDLATAAPRFERALGVRVPLAVRLRRAYVRRRDAGLSRARSPLVTALVLAVPLARCRWRWAAPASACSLVALLALVPGLRPGDRARQPRRSPTCSGPRPLPRLELDDGVPTGPADAGRRADAADQRGGRRGAGRAASRSTTSPTREGDLRFALLSDWLDAPTEHVAGRRRAPRGRRGGDRPAQRAPRRGARRRRPLPALPPRAALERGRRRAGWAGSASAASSRS